MSALFFQKGCPKHLPEKVQKIQYSAAELVLKARERDYVGPFLRTQPILFATAPVFLSDLFMRYLRQDGSAPPLLQKLSAFRTLRPTRLDVALFLCCSILPREPGHIQPLQLKPFQRPFCLKLTAASSFSVPQLVARARVRVCECVCVCVVDIVMQQVRRGLT